MGLFKKNYRKINAGTISKDAVEEEERAEMPRKFQPAQEETDVNSVLRNHEKRIDAIEKFLQNG